MAIGGNLWWYDVTMTATDANGVLGVNTVNGAPNANHRRYIRQPTDITDAQAIANITANYNTHWATIKAGSTATGPHEWLGVVNGSMSITNIHKTTLAERNALRAAGYQIREWTGTDHEYD